MELNLEVCRSIAIQHGLPLQFVVKEFHLMDVLAQVASSGEEMVFKGGTALNKAYFHGGQRFSEDLDFDFDGDITALCRRLSSRLAGYEIGELRRVRGTAQFYCAFFGPLGRDHVRVDVARKKILSSKPVSPRQAVSEFILSSVAVPVYSLEDLVARKMAALASRAEGKDVYDVHSAFPLCEKKPLLKAIPPMLESERSPLTPGEFISKCIAILKKSDPKKLRNLTNPFIPVPYRPKDWLQLRNDLIFKLEEL